MNRQPRQLSQHLSIRLLSLILLFVTSCGLNACSGNDDIAADDSLFQGIPSAIVSEVLASPSSRERAASEDPAQERSLWQGIALNFAQTRDAYRIYVEWRDTGTPPEVAADLKVSEPMQGYKDYLRAQTTLRDIVASGEIEQLRAYLTNQTQGGFWIPARANDVKGPTVADAVKQGL